MAGKLYVRYRLSDGSEIGAWTWMARDAYEDERIRLRIIEDMPNLVPDSSEKLSGAVALGTQFWDLDKDTLVPENGGLDPIPEKDEITKAVESLDSAISHLNDLRKRLWDINYPPDGTPDEVTRRRTG